MPTSAALEILVLSLWVGPNERYEETRMSVMAKDFTINNMKDMNFSFYSKYVIFSHMPADETIHMAGPSHETHLVPN